MLRTVFLKSLRDQRRALVGWSVGLVLLVLLEAALWPSIRDMPDLHPVPGRLPRVDAHALWPRGFRHRHRLPDAELFSALLPILFIVFAVGRGARAVAGEEEAGTLEVLLVTPVSPRAWSCSRPRRSPCR